MTRLGEIAVFVSGGTPSRAIPTFFEGDIAWITGADIREASLIVPRSYITEDAVRESAVSIVPPGTVLLVTRTSVGKVAVADRQLGFSQDITAIIPDRSVLDPSYLAYYLRANRDRLASQARGATILGVSRAEVERIEIPVPSLSEQHRIVLVFDHIDEILAKHRKAIELAESAIDREFNRTIGNVINRDGRWALRRVSEFVAGFSSGRSVAGVVDGPEGSARVLKISAVTSGRFRRDESKPLPLGYRPPSVHFVTNGDLLFSRANTAELVGATALVREPVTNLVLPDKLWKFVWPVETLTNPTFVWKMFSRPEVRARISELATGTSGSMKNVSQSAILGLEVAVPPMGVQSRFARIVDELETIRLKHQEAIQLTLDLQSSLQQSAFRGDI